MDRFSPYGGDNKNIFGLIKTCDEQGLAKGMELIFREGLDSVNENKFEEVKAELDEYGIETIALLTVTIGQDFQKGFSDSSDKKKNREAIDLVKSALDLAAKNGMPKCRSIAWP